MRPSVRLSEWTHIMRVNWLKNCGQARQLSRPTRPKHLHRIIEKGKKYKANPPAEIEAAPPAEIKPSKHLPAASSTVKSTEEGTEESTQKGTEVSPPQPPVPEEKTKTEKGDPAIPSQADIFQSVAEQLSISKQKDRTPLSAVVYRVQRTADLDDLNSLWNAGQVY